MGARVKDATEYRLLRCCRCRRTSSVPASYCTKEARSSVRLYRLSYLVTAPSFPLLRRLFPRHVTTPVNLGLAAAEEGTTVD
jgi:hypothetical protein